MFRPLLSVFITVPISVVPSLSRIFSSRLLSAFLYPLSLPPVLWFGLSLTSNALVQCLCSVFTVPGVMPTAAQHTSYRSHQPRELKTNGIWLISCNAWDTGPVWKVHSTVPPALGDTEWRSMLFRSAKFFLILQKKYKLMVSCPFACPPPQ